MVGLAIWIISFIIVAIAAICIVLLACWPFVALREAAPRRRAKPPAAYRAECAAWAAARHDSNAVLRACMFAGVVLAFIVAVAGIIAGLCVTAQWAGAATFANWTSIGFLFVILIPLLIFGRIAKSHGWL